MFVRIYWRFTDFLPPRSCRLFEQLITVSGIGPKVGLALLTTLSAEQITTAIMSGNADLLSQVPGIGKKTAGRIILDLKGKIGKGWEGEVIPSISQSDSDAVAALTGLGYSIREATQALSNIPVKRRDDDGRQGQAGTATTGQTVR